MTTPYPRCSERGASARAAFTLIELLTVLAIIGVLSAILLPAVARVRQAARNSECVSNLRQWAQAVQLYAHDNKGNYIIKGTADDGTEKQTWIAYSNVIPRMLYGKYFPGSSVVGKVRNCPLRLDGGDGTNGTSYFINRPYLQGATVAPTDAVPLSRVKSPAQFMLFADIDVGLPQGTNPWIIGPGGLATCVTPVLADPAKDRHSGGVNMSFADGHVARVTQADILAKGDRWTRINND